MWCGKGRRGEKEVWGRKGVGWLRRWVKLGWLETMAGWRALGFYNTQADEKVKMLASSKGRVEQSRVGVGNCRSYELRC
jgi:hypothetical protein